MSEILDSGERRQFSSGAVRDIVEGKGRCDLLPLDVISTWLRNSSNTHLPNVLRYISEYIANGSTANLYDALSIFVNSYYGDPITALLEVAKHYEQGCNKYGERNWEKGIPLHCYIDSGVRHLLKLSRGDTDEPHDRAFVWNMLGAIWTAEHHPELIDLPFISKLNGDDTVVTERASKSAEVFEVF